MKATMNVLRITIALLALVFFGRVVFATEACELDSCGTTKDQRSCVMRSCKPTKVITKTKVVEKEVEKVVPVPVVTTQEVIKEVPVIRKNRIGLLLGYGPTGSIREDVEDGYYRYSTEKKAAIGAQYQRLVTERVNVGIQIFSNSFFSVGGGYDF